MNNNVLVIAVHPDDETLGCGGTLLKHKEQGDCLCWLIITKTDESQGFKADFITQRQQEIQQVQQAYGFQETIHLNFPTAQLDTIPMQKLVQEITAVVQRCQPSVIYLPFKSDVHSDHRRVFEAASVCSKTFRFPFVRRMLMMETISETEFSPPFSENAFCPNYYVDITNHLERKKEIMNLYHGETAPAPFPRSIENITALAVYRGSACGCRYAEAFVLLKHIEKE